jgi:hypothetical protein
MKLIIDQESVDLYDQFFTYFHVVMRDQTKGHVLRPLPPNPRPETYVSKKIAFSEEAE